MKPHNVIYAVTWCAPPWKCNYTCHCRPVCISGYFLNCSCFLHLYNFHLNMINNQVFFPLQRVFCRYSWLQLKCMKRRFPQNHFFSPQSIVCTPMDKAKECQRMSETRLSTCTRLQWAARPIKKQLGEINQKWKKNKSSYSLRNSMQALASWIEDDDEKRWWISPKIQRSLSTI